MLQLSQRPLSGSDADDALFSDRTVEVEHLARAADLDFNVLVLGERGIGVTSLIRRYLRRLEDGGRTAFYASAVRAGDLPELLTAIRIGVVGRRGRIFAGQPMMESLMVERDSDPLAELRAVARALDRKEGSRTPIVVLDNMHVPALAHELFGRHRDELWDLPFRWVVCGVVSLRAQYLEPPADAFFDSELTVGPLDFAAASELLERRLANAPNDLESTSRIRGHLEQIIERGNGSPRHLLAAARDALLQTSEEQATANQVQAAAVTLGTAEALMVRHLQAYGPASASDERLLETLHVSRSRATQVLRRLEGAGLVASTSEKGGVGRPRKVYRVVAVLPGARGL